MDSNGKSFSFGVFHARLTTWGLKPFFAPGW